MCTLLMAFYEGQIFGRICQHSYLSTWLSHLALFPCRLFLLQVFYEVQSSPDVSWALASASQEMFFFPPPGGAAGLLLQESLL